MKAFILAFSLFSVWGHSYGTSSEMVLPLLMPKIDPKTIQEDDYKCTAFKLNQNESQYITEFKPNASDPIPLHHIMIYGCENPSDPRAKTEQDYVWSCNGQDSSNCGPGRLQVLYSWSRNAPTYTLPKGVGFNVGGDTKINYLILHVHYFKVDRIKGYNYFA